jgi:hypothetical protein
MRDYETKHIPLYILEINDKLSIMSTPDNPDPIRSEALMTEAINGLNTYCAADFQHRLIDQTIESINNLFHLYTSLLQRTGIGEKLLNGSIKNPAVVIAGGNREELVAWHFAMNAFGADDASFFIFDPQPQEQDIFGFTYLDDTPANIPTNQGVTILALQGKKILYIRQGAHLPGSQAFVDKKTDGLIFFAGNIGPLPNPVWATIISSWSEFGVAKSIPTLAIVTATDTDIDQARKAFNQGITPFAQQPSVLIDQDNTDKLTSPYVLYNHAHVFAVSYFLDLHS